jgi:tetratricopeptide (TPR) repeat protein
MVGLVLPQAAKGQFSSGPSQNFESSLPSTGINRTLGTGTYTSAGRFVGGQSPVGSLVGATSLQIDLQLYLSGTGRDIGGLLPGPGLGPLVGLKLRTIDSLNFDKRARLAKLRETTLALAERIRQTEQSGAGQVSVGFRQFMFPLPLADRTPSSYGFFSQVDLAGGAGVGPEVFLTPFTQEVQESLGDKKYLDAVQAMLFNRALPEGVTLDPFYDTQLSALANFLFSNGRYAAAAQVWGVLADRDPTNTLAVRGQAIALLGSGQMKKAAALFRRSLTMTQGWPDRTRIIGSNLADIFPNARDVAGIREELQAQLAKQPDDADLEFVAAFVDLLRGEVPAAQGALEKLAATDDVARGLLSAVKGGRVAESVKHAAPSALRTAALEVTGFEEPGMTPEARDRLAKVLQVGPSTFDDYMRVGDFRFFMGDFTKAGEAYRAAHKAKPNDPFAQFAQVHVAFANGEYQLASGYLRSALTTEPNWGLYDFRIQEFYGDPDEFKHQLKELERQVQLRPRNSDGRFLLAYIYYFSGRYADAADLLAQLVRVDPNFTEANYFLRLARLQG